MFVFLPGGVSYLTACYHRTQLLSQNLISAFCSGSSSEQGVQCPSLGDSGTVVRTLAVFPFYKKDREILGKLILLKNPYT